MCKKDLKIHFCTCNKIEIYDFPDEIETLQAKEKSKSTLANFRGEYLDTYFKWTLSKFISDGKGEEEQQIILGELITPSNKLNDEFDSHFFEKELNRANLFDFEYTPKELDSLDIFKKYKYIELDDKPRPILFRDFMTFNFVDGKWNFGMSGMAAYETIKKGKVKIT